jgi:hypothetical protein
MLEGLKLIFSEYFFKNLIVVFTHWDHSEDGDIDREGNNTSQETKIKEVNDTFKKWFNFDTS